MHWFAAVSRAVLPSFPRVALEGIEPSHRGARNPGSDLETTVRVTDLQEHLGLPVAGQLLADRITRASSTCCGLVDFAILRVHRGWMPVVECRSVRVGRRECRAHLSRMVPGGPGHQPLLTAANTSFTLRRADARLARQAVKGVACEGPGTRYAVLRPALAGS